MPRHTSRKSARPGNRRSYPELLPDKDSNGNPPGWGELRAPLVDCSKSDHKAYFDAQEELQQAQTTTLSTRKQRRRISIMSQLSPADVASKIASFIQAAGIEFHQEDKNGESYTRVQIGKTFATNPQSLLQSAGAYVLFNLPGNSDKAFAAGMDFLGGGNSQPPSQPLGN